MEIIDLLITKKLLFHAAVSEKTIYRKRDPKSKLERSKQLLIIGKTKALLFNEINKELKKHFPKNMPIFYSVPIVYMNEELGGVLRENTAKV